MKTYYFIVFHYGIIPCSHKVRALDAYWAGEAMRAWYPYGNYFLIGASQ